MFLPTLGGDQVSCLLSCSSAAFALFYIPPKTAVIHGSGAWLETGVEQTCRIETRGLAQTTSSPQGTSTLLLLLYSPVRDVVNSKHIHPTYGHEEPFSD
ncbi:uncharacterized protein BO95DRAFT_424417 [Aspergillus brunneoviolaceus CBS 621.78]|uniref:Uncharacterized protein n=1 Tax=Aspergillus brunneoviolaceus CBS 621.78 TaxID=1450534 RepID=A0ACD1FUE4_9EURO|nr:hypothetical protein BO95DRAFT_424417 [Aspergillus brunneoviolaceus CBS 621.78]RAH40616.1 hypothetical protein BO95DRAFT_424417 [Aspergillus brunneoviolaceus CBS 621.78]